MTCLDQDRQIWLFPSCSALPTQRCRLWSSQNNMTPISALAGLCRCIRAPTPVPHTFHTSVLLKHPVIFQAHCSLSSLLVTFTRSLCSRRNLTQSELGRSNVSSDFSKCYEEISNLIKLRGAESSLLQLCRLTNTCHPPYIRMHRQQRPTRPRYSFAILFFGVAFKANWSVTHFHGSPPVVLLLQQEKVGSNRKKFHQILNCRDKWMKKSLLIS